MTADTQDAERIEPPPADHAKPGAKFVASDGTEFTAPDWEARAKACARNFWISEAEVKRLAALLDARDARIAALEADLAQVSKCWEQQMEINGPLIQKAVDLAAALAQAEARLDRYGQHEPACPRRNAGYYPCECGLAAPAVETERTP